MMSNAWDLEAITANVIEEKASTLITVSWLGYVHVYLQTVSLLCSFYIIIVKNWALQRGNLLSNIFLFVTIGQVIRCFGKQIELIYSYTTNSKEFTIAGTLYFANIGAFLISVGWITLGCTYYYGAFKWKDAYSSVYVHERLKKLYIKLAIIFGIIFIIWMILVSISYDLAAYLHMLTFVPGTLAHFIFYYKLKKSSGDGSSGSASIISVLDNNEQRLYNIGLFGAGLQGTMYLLIVPIVVLFDNDTLRVVLLFFGAIGIGIAYPAVVVGLEALGKISNFQTECESKQTEMEKI